jgi:hypothetical protein
MAMPADTWHRPALRHSNGISTLELPQQETRLTPSRPRKWPALDLTMKPNKGLVFRAHMAEYMSVLTYIQVGI